MYLYVRVFTYVSICACVCVCIYMCVCLHTYLYVRVFASRCGALLLCGTASTRLFPSVMPLPAGWSESFDPVSKRPYYSNHVLKVCPVVPQSLVLFFRPLFLSCLPPSLAACLPCSHPSSSVFASFVRFSFHFPPLFLLCHSPRNGTVP